MTYAEDSVINRKVRVLLVDDHAIWRGGVVSMLESTEFDVVGEAASGREALEEAAVCKPDLVLLDIRMAGGDGLDALVQYCGSLAGILP